MIIIVTLKNLTVNLKLSLNNETDNCNNTDDYDSSKNNN
jgi:hypothetical protein